jgi:hypothetical protein
MLIGKGFLLWVLLTWFLVTGAKINSTPPLQTRLVQKSTPHHLSKQD